MAEHRSDRSLGRAALIASIVHFIPMLLLLIVAAIAHLWFIDAAFGAMWLLLGAMVAVARYRRRHGITSRPWEQRWAFRHRWLAALSADVVIVAVAALVEFLVLHPGPDRDAAMGMTLSVIPLMLLLVFRFWVGAAAFSNRLRAQIIEENRRFAQHHGSGGRDGAAR
jgi:F0F1-type ATP synthase assembly protein I